MLLHKEILIDTIIDVDSKDQSLCDFCCGYLKGNNYCKLYKVDLNRIDNDIDKTWIDAPCNICKRCPACISENFELLQR